MPTCSFYWGDSPLSWLRWMTLCSFRVYNPDWKIRLYTSDAGKKSWPDWEGIDQDFHTYEGMDWRTRLPELDVEVVPYEGSGSAVSNADLCRWQVLADGGIFADMDIVFTRPFDDSVMQDSHAITVECGYAYLGLTTSPGGRLFADILEEARKPLNLYQSAGTDAVYRYAYGHSIGPDCERKDLIAALAEKSGERVVNLPKRWVLPVEIQHVFSKDYDYANDVDVYGVHWFAGGKDGHQASLTYTPETFARNCVKYAADRAYSLWGQHV